MIIPKSVQILHKIKQLFFHNWEYIYQKEKEEFLGETLEYEVSKFRRCKDCGTYQILDNETGVYLDLPESKIKILEQSIVEENGKLYVKPKQKTKVIRRVRRKKKDTKENKESE